MSKTIIQDGRYLTLTAPVGGVTSGDGVKIGQIFGVAEGTYAAADTEMVLDTLGVHDLPKLGTDVVDAGDALYWDDGNSRLTLSTATGLLLVGYATVAAGNGVTTVACRLDGVTRLDEA